MAESLNASSSSTPVNPVDGRTSARRAMLPGAGDVVKPDVLGMLFRALKDAEIKQGAAAAYMDLDEATLSRIKTAHENDADARPKLDVAKLDELPIEFWREFDEELDRMLGKKNRSEEERRESLRDLLEFCNGMVRLVDKVVD